MKWIYHEENSKNLFSIFNRLMKSIRMNTVYLISVNWWRRTNSCLPSKNRHLLRPRDWLPSNGLVSGWTGLPSPSYCEKVYWKSGTLAYRLKCLKKHRDFSGGTRTEPSDNKEQQPHENNWNIFTTYIVVCWIHFIRYSKTYKSCLRIKTSVDCFRFKSSSHILHWRWWNYLKY